MTKQKHTEIPTITSTSSHGRTNTLKCGHRRKTPQPNLSHMHQTNERTDQTQPQTLHKQTRTHTRTDTKRHTKTQTETLTTLKKEKNKSQKQRSPTHGSNKQTHTRVDLLSLRSLFLAHYTKSVHKSIQRKNCGHPSCAQRASR